MKISTLATALILLSQYIDVSTSQLTNASNKHKLVTVDDQSSSNQRVNTARLLSKSTKKTRRKKNRLLQVSA